MPSDPALEPLERFLGTWTTEATHPAMPGVVVHGTAVVEWLEGEHFLIHRARTDHVDFPDSIWIIGFTDSDRVDDKTRAVSPRADAQLTLHYFDSRGVFRVYHASADDTAFRFWRTAPKLSQRFTGTFADDGNTIVGRTQMCEDDVNWRDDLAITYRRQR